LVNSDINKRVGLGLPFFCDRLSFFKSETFLIIRCLIGIFQIRFVKHAKIRRAKRQLISPSFDLLTSGISKVLKFFKPASGNGFLNDFNHLLLIANLTEA